MVNTTRKRFLSVEKTQTVSKWVIFLLVVDLSQHFYIFFRIFLIDFACCKFAILERIREQERQFLWFISNFSLFCSQARGFHLTWMLPVVCSAASIGVSFQSSSSNPCFFIQRRLIDVLCCSFVVGWNSLFFLVLLQTSLSETLIPADAKSWWFSFNCNF